MASYKEAFKQSLEYFNGDELAANVFLGKYALKSPSGDILEPTPKEMHQRLAKELARIEAKYPNPMSEEEIFGLLDRFQYIVPQGSPMAAIGNPYQLQSLSNCFVVPTGDSYGAICKTDEQLAQIMKRRGGCGTDISPIRPKGLPTKNAAGTTDGIAVFMERFSNTCREVAQNGRRGAEMQTISVHHPEIETFINIKRDLKKVTGANISIRLTDEFMNAVKDDKDFELRWPVTGKPVVSKMVQARHIWNQIIEAAWACAEPGLLFWDNIIKNSPADCYPNYQTTSTNPCSELPLSNFDACRLLVVNLMGFVDDAYTKQAHFNWKKFSDVSEKAQRLMDDIVDLEIEILDKIIAKVLSDPEDDETKRTELELWKKIKTTCVNGRRTGLGVTAVGDMVAALGMRYGSEDSIRFVEHVYRTLCMASYQSSITMAKERGTFPAFDRDLEKDNLFLNRVWNGDKELHKDYLKHGRRNIANLTTAPVGSISILTQTTSGIEPAFLITYKRRKKINPNDLSAQVDFVDELGDKWQEFKVYHHGFKRWMEINEKTDEDIEQSAYWKATSNDLDWLAGVELQSKAQLWIDHAISRTTNLPNDATKELVGEIYMKAWESGCKGFTVYRDGSRAGVLVSDEEKPKKENKPSFTQHNAPKRPIELECDVYHMQVNNEKWVIFIGLLEGKPFEIMGGLAEHITLPRRVKHGKIVKQNGEITPAQYHFHYDYNNPEDEGIVKDIGNVFENPTNSAFSRTISLSLRHGASVQFVVEQLEKGADKESDMFSYSRAVSRVLKNYIKDNTKVSGKKCPECKGTELAYQEGCLRCLNVDCGYSKCG